MVNRQLGILVRRSFNEGGGKLNQLYQVFLNPSCENANYCKIYLSICKVYFTFRQINFTK